MDVREEYSEDANKVLFTGLSDGLIKYSSCYINKLLLRLIATSRFQIY